MNPILALFLLELKKKKQTIRPKSLAAMGVVLGVFILAFFLLSTYGVRQENVFYTMQPTGTGSDSYFDAPPFRLDERSPHTLETYPNGYAFRSRKGILGVAAQMAFLDVIRETNHALLEHYGYEPVHMLLLNVTSEFREEILDENGGAAQNNLPVHLPGDEEEERLDITQQNITEDDDALSRIIDGPDADVPDGSSIPEEGQPLDTTSEVVEAVERNDRDPAEREDGAADVAEGLVPVANIDTLDSVRDIFLVIALIFILNFLSALFGNSIFEEKLNHRSSLLFVSRIKAYQFIIGKALPYFLAAMIIMVLIVGVQHPHALAHAATYLTLFSLSLIYFSIACLNGLLARSNKEYSFLNVFSIAGVSLYLLIPAFVAKYSSLGYASLFTPLIFIIQQSPVRFDLLLFLLPTYTLVGLGIFYIGSRIWNYEELYQYTTPLEKLRSMIGQSLNRAWHYVVYGVFAVPFAWVVQLILIILLLVVDLPGETVMFLVLAAFSEEIFKNLGLYSKMHQVIEQRKDGTYLDPRGFFRWKTMVKRSFLNGAGFLFAEKVVLILAIAPFLQGYELFITAGLIIPFLLHSSLTLLYLLWSRRYAFARRHYLMSSFCIGLVHAMVNLVILIVFGVGIV
ncbi:MAG: hypothetical protein ACOCWQ_00820 [Nanoarchaeota archaeon]